MKLSGWGRFPTIEATLHEPGSKAAFSIELADAKESLIARGAGRSYGDSALAATVLSSRNLDNFIALEQNEAADTAILHCAAGVSLDSVLRLITPKGIFLPVVPGTRFVSVGGAIAADIHGKNHHRDGCFSNFLESFTLLLANGETRLCSRDENQELFAATCGGMGLTGIILDAKIHLHKVPGLFINNKTLIASNLDECFDLMEANANAHYSVAWVDCLKRGSALGRSCLFLGEHTETPARHADKEHRSGTLLNVPFTSPSWLLNSLSMRSFNSLYFQRQQLRRAESLVHYLDYFFPLDKIGGWNRLYGKRGFIQYQCALPRESARNGVREILERVSAAGKGSFLAVLKLFGAANDNPLSFPIAGATLTLDFKMEDSLPPLLNELDAVVLNHGGRLYLAKDARMSEATFKASYPRWGEFMAIRETVDPDQKFASLQASRLGLAVDAAAGRQSGA